MTDSPIQRGDVRFAEGGGRVGPVLVLAVDRLGFADVLLMHTATEMACDIDLVVPRAVSEMTFDLVVEPDLRAMVWLWQLSPALGRLDDDVLDALTVQDPGGAPWRGLPLAGPSDPRWQFKKDEGATLRILSRDCTRAMLALSDRTVNKENVH